ncbi:SLATT domain-containing protein [Azospirillum argentinense]
MEQTTQSHDDRSYEILEQQIRELYGRVVYTHKTHEKAAEDDGKWADRSKLWQIGLSAIVTAGAITAIVVREAVPIITALVSAALTGLQAYQKNMDPASRAQKHRSAAAELWSVRESYLSLITDLAMRAIPIEEARRRRDELQERLSAVYNTAPATDAKAYGKAQKGLKQMEELTFSPGEIDKFLPQALRTSERKNINGGDL